MTSTIPPMRGAGEVAPLPRSRTPQSTSTHTLGVVPPPPTPVRMKTASPSRGTTIPPLARASTPPPIPGAVPTEAKVTHSTPTLESPRISRPSLPPPRPSRPTLPAPRSTSSGMPVPRTTMPPIPAVAAPAIDVEIKFEATPTMPTPTAPAADLPSPFAVPSSSPFAAEPHGFPIVKPAPPIVPAAPIAKSRGTGSAPIVRHPSVDLTADVIRGDNWFDVSSKVEKLHEETWVGKYTEGHHKTLKDWARMLAVPAIVAASVGVAIGVYISYRGGNHAAAPKTSASSITTHVHAPPPTPAKIVNLPVTGTAPDPNAESSNAATASAGGDQPQPPTKQEDAAKQQAAAAQAAANPNDPAAEPMLTHDVAQPAIAQPSPAAPAGDAPSVQEIKTSHGIVKLVDVRINSKPAGATVMLVDDGKTSFLGTTPIATSVDASKTYDVIFTLNGRPTQMAHLDPATSAKLEVKIPHGHASDAVEEAPTAPMVNDTTLEAKEEAAAKAETPKPVAKVATKTEAPKAVKTETPKAETPKAVKAVAKTETPKTAKKSAKTDSFDEEEELRSLGLDPKKSAKKSEPKADAGEGTLMVSSKPPCEILVDGKATGLTTPQRSIALAAGAHKITFVNASANIKKTVAVSIKASQSTKLIQDLMK